MPHQTAPLTPRQLRANKAEKARKLLAGVSRRQDDSSDEDDDAWEWIYEDGDESADEVEDEVASKKRKRHNVSSTQKRTIIGAKNGGFKCSIGDSVLLKAEDGNPPWIGMILSFLEDDDGDMAADFICTDPGNLFESEGLMFWQGFRVRKRLSTRRRRDPTFCL
jgi:origin recognition complex subunit 1